MSGAPVVKAPAGEDRASVLIAAADRDWPRHISQPQPGIARLIRVWDHQGFENRMGTILNIALLASLSFTLVAVFFFAILAARGLFDVSPALIVGICVGGITVYGLGIYFNRRGQYTGVTHTYVWLLSVLSVLGVLFFGGIRSAIWLFFLWPVTAAAIFISPRAMLGIFGGMAALWGVLWLGESTGMYRPPPGIAPEQYVSFIPIFFLALLSVSVALLAYVFAFFEDTRRHLEQITGESEAFRHSLERQVVERTAEAQQRSDSFRLVAEIQRASATTTDPDKLLNDVTGLIVQRLPVHFAGIFLMDEAGEWVVLEAASLALPDSEQLGADKGRAWRHGLRLKVGGQGIVGHAAATVSPYIVPDVSVDPYYVYDENLHMTRAEAAFPIVMYGRVMGVLDVHAIQAASFTEQNLQLLGVLADSLAVALENSRRLEASRRTVERLSQYEEEELLRQWQRALQRRGGRLRYLYDRVKVTALPISRGTTELPGAADISEIQVISPAEGLFTLVAPLNIRGRTLGRFAFELDRPWRQDEIAVVESVVSQLGLALENARLLESTRRSAALEQTASELTSRIRAQVEIETVLERALADLGQALGAERAAARLMLTGDGPKETAP
ncbi:MAG: GAF domain-containing protein [Anaerolineae bacterium]|nr:GAF domain-containing protein [Anaerolineae bacterium]